MKPRKSSARISLSFQSASASTTTDPTTTVDTNARRAVCLIPSCWPCAGNKKPPEKDGGPHGADLLGVEAPPDRACEAAREGADPWPGRVRLLRPRLARDARGPVADRPRRARGGPFRLALGAHEGRPRDAAAEGGGDPARAGGHDRGRTEPARPPARLWHARGRRARDPVRAATARRRLARRAPRRLNCGRNRPVPGTGRVPPGRAEIARSRGFANPVCKPECDAERTPV